jgi:predicted RNA-binding protein associated with RNAse of E/G family
VIIRPSGAIEILDEDELARSLEPRFRIAMCESVRDIRDRGRRLIAEIERETTALL